MCICVCVCVLLLFFPACVCCSCCFCDVSFPVLAFSPFTGLTSVLPGPGNSGHDHQKSWHSPQNGRKQTGVKNTDPSVIVLYFIVLFWP